MQNAPGLTFIMKEMVKHLANLLFVDALFIFLLRKRTKSGAEYNIKLIGQPTNYFIFSDRCHRHIVCGYCNFDCNGIHSKRNDTNCCCIHFSWDGATDLCLGTGCRNNEPERLRVILGINSPIACKK